MAAISVASSSCQVLKTNDRKFPDCTKFIIHYFSDPPSFIELRSNFRRMGLTCKNLDEKLGGMKFSSLCEETQRRSGCYP